MGSSDPLDITQMVVFNHEKKMGITKQPLPLQGSMEYKKRIRKGKGMQKLENLIWVNGMTFILVLGEVGKWPQISPIKPVIDHLQASPQADSEYQSLMWSVFSQNGCSTSHRWVPLVQELQIWHQSIWVPISSSSFVNLGNSLLCFSLPAQ